MHGYSLFITHNGLKTEDKQGATNELSALDRIPALLYYQQGVIHVENKQGERR